jgi:mannose-6-phosphate isomerase-like protein (cupin superfamily)
MDIQSSMTFVNGPTKKTPPKGTPETSPEATPAPEPKPRQPARPKMTPKPEVRPGINPGQKIKPADPAERLKERKKEMLQKQLQRLQMARGIISKLVMSEKASNLKGFVTDIEKDTVKNSNFRKILYTGKNSQLVLMSLKPGEDIGEETHKDTDQFFRVDSGKGQVIINDKSHDIKDGFAIVIPQGAKHNVVNTGKEPLKIYSIYSPPHHQKDVVHKTKEEAEADKEHFDGKTTE